LGNVPWSYAPGAHDDWIAAAQAAYEAHEVYVFPDTSEDETSPWRAGEPTEWGVECSHPIGGDWTDVAPDEESARRAVATHSFATKLVRRVGSGPWVEVTD
jgi:hypothetical protein